jgi:hypothetical protein
LNGLAGYLRWADLFRTRDELIRSEGGVERWKYLRKGGYKAVRLEIRATY